MSVLLPYVTLILHLVNQTITSFYTSITNRRGQTLSYTVFMKLYTFTVVFYKSQLWAWFPLHWFSLLATKGRRPASDSFCLLHQCVHMARKCIRSKTSPSQTTPELSPQNTPLAIYSSHSFFIINSSHAPEKNNCHQWWYHSHYH